jgi:putative toxin-antitoxin system antitoxin component (TIGR02293 family)
MATIHTEEETKRIVALLGGEKVFRSRIKDRHALHLALRKGLPYGAFEALVDTLGVRLAELADVLGVASRTLARRKSKRYLSPTESDRLYRIAHITFLACEVLGSLEKARKWLHRDNRALGGETPMANLDTEIGARQVEELLLRISYGIYS